MPAVDYLEISFEKLYDYNSVRIVFSMPEVVIYPPEVGPFTSVADYLVPSPKTTYPAAKWAVLINEEALAHANSIPALIYDVVKTELLKGGQVFSAVSNKEVMDKLVSVLQNGQNTLLGVSQKISILNEYFGTMTSAGSRTEQETLKKMLPGLSQNVNCPVDHGEAWRDSLWYVIQHLNDRHRWPRESIADWLESLDIDLTFPEPEK
jgi:hypothetical protein